ncbi:MAG TPA: DUF3267 domain-containing protein [Candidatus Gallacutalibacter pullistercoris]|nr:DUF3267 domain-containing protein [Candidatus Gallacutalibacter pullistercoris]
MKLVWKGRYQGEEQLPKAILPAGCIQYQEPDSLEELNRAAARMIFWPLLAAGIALLLRWLFWGAPGWRDSIHLGGAVLALLFLLPHELLHAVAYPRGAVCEFWASLRDGCLFVVSLCPVSRTRFLYISLLPALVLGVLPLILWVCLPQAGGLLFTTGALHLTACVGDFLNVKNTILQVPKGAMIQQSGLHSYWYLPEKSKKK